MDYDAVIARHLAARQSGGNEERGQLQVTVPTPARGSFGRKGL
jgi:hypothetical protein